MSNIPVRDGKLDFHVDSVDTPCHTYYKVIGDISPTGPPPLVILHGGPGAGHEYCLPLSKVWSLYGIPSIHYDQIGCAASTHFREKVDDRSFWSIGLFVAELENLLDHFHLRTLDGPGYHLLGHSWGGFVAIDHASRHPPGLRKLVVFGTPATGELFSDGLVRLRKQLSPEAQAAINEAIETHDTGSLALLAAMNEFQKKFMCHADPWPPKEIAISHKNISDDRTVRTTL